MNSVTVAKLLEDINSLEIITGEHTLDNEIKLSEVSRPGIELTGYTEYFPYLRVQVLGKQEVSYLNSIDFNEEKIRNFLNPKIPLIVFARGQRPSDKFLEIANELDIPICVTTKATSKIFTILYSYLEYQLAPETQVHGVLLSVLGKGVLIKGGSGVGKSEVALELIKQGHYLIADDAVVIRKTDENELIGSAPELLQNRLEIRGIGIVDIQKLYGVTRVMKKKKIDLVAELKPMSGTEDRIGNNLQTECILDAKIPKVIIPINVGRSISNLIEVAVANFELRTEYDYDSAQAFVEDLNSILSEKGSL